MNIADLSLLPALDALLDEANVTRAAERLGISQPSLSAKLARLRVLTGDPLLVPSGSGRGMVLTPSATRLRIQAREALRQAEAALRAAPAFEPDTSHATLRIIANDNSAALMLPSMLAEIIAHGARRIRIALLRPNEKPLAERLEAGDADIAIALDRTLPGGERLHRRPILLDRFVTAQRKGHPRGSTPLNLDGFCAAIHLLVSGESGSFSGVVDEQLRALGRTRQVALSLHSYTLAPLVIARSDLLGTLPRRLLDQYAVDLDLFEPPLEIEPFTLVALWHDRVHDDGANRWLRERLFAVMGMTT
ncbi:LysR family transcriptional regulator [Paraburkholderia sp. J41]|uniref:LysR family transcriptional regulator n=1 Tax=Paraburkholderia sp. J41 TaxID=2805433 RepID=UPI002AC32884|nr:LysR family transcriptional regulator [Paraburkholderia sp. J41]